MLEFSEIILPEMLAITFNLKIGCYLFVYLVLLERFVVEFEFCELKCEKPVVIISNSFYFIS